MVSYMNMRATQANSLGNEALSVVNAGVKIGEGILGLGIVKTGINVMKKTFTALTGRDIPTNAQMSAEANHVGPSKKAYTPGL